MAGGLMKILNIGQNHFVRGGSDRYFFDLTRLLKERAHEVRVFSAAHPKNIASEDEQFFPNPVNFENPGLMDLGRFIYNPQAAKKIDLLLQDANPDIAHLHIYYGQLTSSILGPLRKRRVPVVQTLHEYRLVCPTSHLIANGAVCQACEGHKFYQAVIRRCNRGSIARSALSAVETYVAHANGAVRHVDHFIAVSGFLRRKMIQMGVPEEKISTVHNFVDVAQFFPATAPGEYVLFFGRLEFIKGVMTLLEAAAGLPNVRFLFAGDGAARPAMQLFVKERALSNVEFVGFKSGEALHSLIRGSICTVSPSEWYETFGLTLVESFALGRPVVCTDMGGMPEIVTDGLDGFIVPPRDVSALKERIELLCRDSSMAVRMGKAGRRTVESRFSPGHHIEAVENIYRSVGFR